MKQILRIFTSSAATVVLLTWSLAVPAAAQGKVAGGGGGGKSAPAPSAPSGGSGATSSGAPSGGAPSGGAPSSGGHVGGGFSGGHDGDSGRRSGSTGGSGYAAPHSPRAAESGGNTGSSGAKGGSGSTGVNIPSGESGRRTASDGSGRTNNTPGSVSGGGVPAYARPRDGNEPVGTAVPRGTTPRPPGGTTGIFIPGGYYGGGYGYYDPWGYNGGYGYYGGYYDPWYGGYPIYSQGPSYTSGDEGSLRLKIKPKEGEVYVDGYYVGIVDDFDGIFQRLHLESGAHRIEVRAPGYEPLAFDVHITADHTITYQGELKKIQ